MREKISSVFQALSKASRSVAETLKSFKFFVVGSKQTDEERDIGSFFLSNLYLKPDFQ